VTSIDGEPPILNVATRDPLTTRVGERGWDQLGWLSVTQVAWQALFSGLSFVWAICVARLLGVEGKGAVSALSLLSTTGCAVAVLGTADAILYTIGRDGQGAVRRLWFVCLLHALCAAACGGAVGAIIARGHVAAFGSMAMWAPVVAGALAGVMTFNRQQQMILIGAGRVNAAGVGPALQCTCALIGLSVIAARGHASVASAFLAYGVSHLIASAITSAQIIRLGGRQTSPVNKIGRGYWRFSLRAFPGTIAKYLNFRLDQTVIAAILGAQPLGLYGAAVNVAEIGGYATNAVALNVLPSVARSDNPRRLAFSGLVMAGTAGLGAVLCLALIGPWILGHLFGRDFIDSTSILYILLPGILASGIGNVAASIAAGLGRPLVGSVAALSGLFVTAVGVVWAIPRFGLVGGAWVSTAAYCLSCIVALIGLLRGRDLAVQASDKRVLVTHVYSDANAGDAGILAGLVQLLRGSGNHKLDAWSTLAGPEGELRGSIPFSEAEFAEIHPALWPGLTETDRVGGSRKGVGRYVRFALHSVRGIMCLCVPWTVHLPIWSVRESRALRACRDASLVVCKGGGFFYSTSHRETLFLARMLLPIAIAAHFRKRVVLAGHTIGPLRGGVARAMLRTVINQSEAQVFVRESESAKFLRELGVPEVQIHMTSDTAFALDADGVDLLRDRPTGGTGITVRQWAFPGMENTDSLYRNYITAVANYARHRKSHGQRVILIAQVTGPTRAEDDRIACEDVRKATGPGVIDEIIEGPKAPNEWIELYSSLTVVVATRLHSAIFALIATTPTVVISYGIKADAIMRDRGRASDCLPIAGVTADALIRTTGQVLSDREGRDTWRVDPPEKSGFAELSSALDSTGLGDATVTHPFIYVEGKA